MRTKIFQILLVAVLVFLTLTSSAQEKVAMADDMRSEGKIYVVVAVILTILAGLIFYVWRLDRKITKLENDKS